MEWTRIPEPIPDETDRRALVGILTAHGLAVRIVRVKRNENRSAPYDRFVEFAKEE